MSLTRLSLAATAGNAVGTLTVPANATDVLKYAMVTLTTDGTVANRTVVLNLKDGSTVLFTVSAGAVQAAGVTARQHTFFPQADRETTVVNSTLMIPIPELVATTGQTFNVSITNGVAGDSFTASFLVDRL